MSMRKKKPTPMEKVLAKGTPPKKGAAMTMKGMPPKGMMPKKGDKKGCK